MLKYGKKWKMLVDSSLDLEQVKVKQMFIIEFVYFGIVFIENAVISEMKLKEIEM